MENNETDEQRSIVDFYSVLNSILVMSFIYSLRFSYQYYFLSPRMSLLLRDSEIILELMITIPTYYFKNPLLRHYILKNVLRRSTVGPESNEIELQSIYVLRRSTVHSLTVRPENNEIELQSINVLRRSAAQAENDEIELQSI